MTDIGYFLNYQLQLSVYIATILLLLFPLFRGTSRGSIDNVSTFCNIDHMKEKDEKQFDHIARLFRILGNPMRLAVVEALQERPWCVCELASQLDLHKSAMSKHLSLLKSVGVVEMEKVGTRVNCSLVMPCVFDMIQCANNAMNTACLSCTTENSP